MDFITISVAAERGQDLSGLSRQNIRQLERRYSDDLPAEYHGLMEVWRWASMGGRAPKISPEHPAFFYALRSSQHKDRDLVNMLLSDLSRLDFRQLFICHKALFYEAYRGWTDSKKEYVSDFLAQEYTMDKVGAREALFGDEPDMVEPEPKPSLKTEFTNPWGKAEVKEGLYKLKPHSEDKEDFRELYKDYRKKNYRKSKKSKGD